MTQVIRVSQSGPQSHKISPNILFFFFLQFILFLLRLVESVIWKNDCKVIEGFLTMQRVGAPNPLVVQASTCVYTHTHTHTHTHSCTAETNTTL